MKLQDRQSYLDWLRMLAIIGVLFFHSGMPYVAEEGWHIKNKETSNILLEFNYWMSRFRMPLLFFVSGAITYFILKRKTGWQFVGIRFKRLIIPLIFGMLIIVPPQIYMERITQGFRGSYLDFYPSIFEGKPYPSGNTSWHHLWFILYLFIYNLIAAPLFVWLLSERGKKWSEKIHWLGKGKWIYLIMLPGVIWFTAFVLRYNQTNDLMHDYTFFPYWFFFLLAGFICITNQPLIESLRQNRRISLLMATLTFVAINYFRWNQLDPWDTISNYENDWRTYAVLALRASTAWFWVFALIGYGKEYLNKKHRILNYINEAVYPFYILHQTIIVILAFYFVQTTDTISTKYTATIFTTFFLSMLIYHLFIRPYNITRFLFGMAPIRKNIVEDIETHPLSIEQPERKISTV